MSAKTIRKIGIVMLIVAPLEIIGAFWWWATTGLDEKIGTAHTITAFIMLFAGVFLLSVSLDMEIRDRRYRR